MTNGLLLTPEVWEKMSKIHSNIENIFISIDAATSQTYEKVRVNGKYETLLKNVEFLGQKRRESKLEYLTFAFIVQKNNYKEMADIIEVARRYNVDRVVYSLLDDWESWQKEDYLKNAVCNPEHPEYPQFLEILKNPVFDDPIVNLGNITCHRVKALSA
jgi:MoaA/NifB/PqqE/SkfB family radical SAM enzyme